MSHKATNWAIERRGIPPAAKVVLWHLCDRYHPENGCFPSQNLLATDCEMSRSSLNDQLDKLEEAGLIRRERRHGEGNRRQSTRYILGFEPGFISAKPCAEIGHGSMSENPEEPCPNLAESHVRNSDINPVREPVIEPERERAREYQNFAKVLRSWPSGFADSRQEAWEAWQSLGPEDRATAASEVGRFANATKAVGRKVICGFAAYLRERRWEALPPQPVPVSRPEGLAAPHAPKPKGRPTAFQRSNPHLYPELFGPASQGAEGSSQ